MSRGCIDLQVCMPLYDSYTLLQLGVFREVTSRTRSSSFRLARPPTPPPHMCSKDLEAWHSQNVVHAFVREHSQMLHATGQAWAIMHCSFCMHSLPRMKVLAQWRLGQKVLRVRSCSCGMMVYWRSGVLLSDQA